MQIESRVISPKNEPFIIAEMSGNHNRSLNRALEIVEAAAKSGAHGIKLQTYTADTMTIDVESDDFRILDPKSPWYNRSLYDLYLEAYTPWEWHEPIFNKARELGLICFSTPFDESAVQFLEDLNVPCYKIASFELTDISLIKAVAATRKPLILSTGMATVAEIEEAVSVARENGCKDIVLLKCTSTYPASPETCNLRTLPHMRDLFNCEIGLSDHTLGIGAAVAAVALGAAVIEKHFTLDRASGGVDASFSIEPDEMKSLVSETRNSWLSLGNVSYCLSDAEKASLKFRRSLYICADMDAGEIVSTKNVKAIRPGNGLQPKFLNMVLGRELKKQAPKGTPLSWDLLC